MKIKMDMNQSTLVNIMLGVLFIMAVFLIGKILGYGNSHEYYTDASGDVVEPSVLGDDENDENDEIDEIDEIGEFDDKDDEGDEASFIIPKTKSKKEGFECMGMKKDNNGDPKPYDDTDKLTKV